jgi:hypothetical protein
VSKLRVVLSTYLLRMNQSSINVGLFALDLICMDSGSLNKMD